MAFTKILNFTELVSYIKSALSAKIVQDGRKFKIEFYLKGTSGAKAKFFTTPVLDVDFEPYKDDLGMLLKERIEKLSEKVCEEKIHEMVDPKIKELEDKIP